MSLGTLRHQNQKHCNDYFNENTFWLRVTILISMKLNTFPLAAFNLRRKNKYDDAWIKNFMNGFRINLALPQFGAIIYMRQYNGKKTTTRNMMNIFSAAALRRKPGTPSYHSVANNYISKFYKLFIFSCLFIHFYQVTAGYLDGRQTEKTTSLSTRLLFEFIFAICFAIDWVVLNLFLFEFDGKFQTGQTHVIAIGIWWRFGVMIQNDGQLLRATRLIQEIHGELLTLATQFQIIRFAFLFSKCQVSQFPWQFECGQQRIHGAQSNQRWTGQCPVFIQTAKRIS